MLDEQISCMFDNRASQRFARQEWRGRTEQAGQLYRSCCQSVIGNACFPTPCQETRLRFDVFLAPAEPPRQMRMGSARSLRQQFVGHNAGLFDQRNVALEIGEAQ